MVSETSRAIVTDERTITLPDGAKVTLVRWHAGTFSLGLHFGSQDPPSTGLPITAADGDAISAAEAPRLLGAFNGGFKVATGSGGFEANGVTAVPLVAGDASLVIDQNGTVHIGTWGQGLPAPGEQVLSVRQNLQLLISNGVTAANIGNVPAWGATLGGVNVIARSAVALDAHGNLIYAASMDAVPADLASALTQVGAVNAMELDINPYWVQCDTAATPGGPLSPAIPGQQRPANTYQLGWTRDFFTVLATGG